MASDGSCRIAFGAVAADGVRVARLGGELDASTVDAVRSSLAEAVETHPDVVLDLEELTFLSAAGIRLLLEIREACRAGGGDLTVRSPGRLARRVFVITKTEDLLERGSDPTVAPTEPTG